MTRHVNRLAPRGPAARSGLSIVKHIALAHRGRVDVDSIPGTGSTFRIFLPLNSTRA